MVPSDKPKKTKTKPPKSRPAATSALSQPVVDDASNTSVLSAFSPNGNLFAFLSLAVDKHRLRVYDTLTGQSAAELTIDSARVSSLSWSNFDTSDSSKAGSKESTTSPSKKRRKKRDSVDAPEEVPKPTIEVVILGLSDGSIMFFSPTHGRVLRTLTHSSSTAAIECVAVAHTQDATIWTSSADGTIHLWNPRTNEIIGNWKNDDRIPYSSMAIRPTHQDDRLDILAAHHSIRLLSTQSSASSIDKKKPKQLVAFTGHASRIKHLEWDSPTRFLSLAEADRFIYIWEVPEGSMTEGTSVASIPLESDARAFSLSGSSDSQKQTLLALSTSGKASIFPIPAELVPPASSNRTQHKIATLTPHSNITVSSDNNSSPSRIISVAFAQGQAGHVRVARIVGGIRPVFDVVQYLDDSGEFIKSITLEDILDNAIDRTIVGAPNKRYAEPTSIAVGPGLDEDMDDLITRDIDGDLDVDLAELSLGQRLTALSGAGPRPASDSDDEAAPKARKPKNKKLQEAPSVVPANSLTRTLIQALHSSDSRLLETCLAHSDQTLIRNTIRRLPPQLAVPLINACVERLGRGARAENMKGGGGGASSQRGMGLITWVKTVLIVHSGHLMTIPDLVARLAGLHSTLTTRLALQESLLTLHGRLDMVLSQMEMRSSAAPAPLTQWKGKSAPKTQEREVVHYVEGESEEDEDDLMSAEVDVESGDDAGSVEDVELGGPSEDDDDVDDSDGEDTSDEPNDSDGEPTMNGFIDDEAEEYSDGDEDEDESE